MAPEGALEPEGFVDSADGTKLAFRAWAHAGARITLAVVHGLGDHSGRYEDFAHAMASRGMAAVAVDLRGHGKSPGQRGHVDSWSQWTDDASAFVRYVESVAGGEVVPLGHSYGGAVMLSSVLAGKLPATTRFIVSSPALKLKMVVPAWKVSLGRVTSSLAPKVSLSTGLDPRSISRLPEVVEAYRNDPLVHSQISSRTYAEWQTASRDILARAGDIKIPFLIIAGADDPLIDPAGSRELHAKAPGASELHLLEGRYHEPINDRDNEGVFSLIAAWLAKT